MHRARLALLPVILPAAVAAAPQAEPAAVQLVAQSWQLRESAADGRVLVTERATLPGLRFSVSSDHALAWTWTAGLAGGDAEYDGRTQAGAPVRRTTRTAIVEFAGRLAVPLGNGWALEAGAGGEVMRRRIEGRDGRAGLDERSAVWGLGTGLAWAEDRARFRAFWTAGPAGLLHVRFDGGVYDPASLRTGAVRGTAFEGAWPLAGRWSIVGGAERLRVGASVSVPLRGAGVVVGRVAQPRWTRDRFWLGLACTWP